MSPKSDFNANSDHDLAERLRRIEDLPIERDIKNILSVAEVMANWIDDLGQIVADSILDNLNAKTEGEYHPLLGNEPTLPTIAPKFADQSDLPLIFRTCQPFHDDPDYDDQ